MRFGWGSVFQAISDKMEDYGEDRACQTVQAIIDMGFAEEAEPMDIITAIEEYIEWELGDKSLESYIERLDDVSN